jgi:CRISPR-associated protein Csb1
MPDTEKQKISITPADVLKGDSPLVLVATLEPVAGLDRFQPAGFPEVGHVMYKAPRDGRREENVCIVDSAASMANHLESVCLRGPHDYELVDELHGMPYVRCVTGALDGGKVTAPEIVVISLTEGHRIASTYFLDGLRDTSALSRSNSLREDAKKLKEEAKKLQNDGKKNDGKKKEEEGKKKDAEAKKIEQEATLQAALIRAFGIELAGSSNAHPPAEKWWNVFQTIFQFDPNSLVHGVLFPQWQIKIPRVLTAHLEAFGAGRVDRSGVKFDRLGKTTSGQPIFAVDDATAREIRATFILDLSLVRSFGRRDGGRMLGLTDDQKEFLLTLALWKIQRLLAAPFRFRSGCHLRCASLKSGGQEVELSVNIKDAIRDAGFTTDPRITDVWWPREELYREGKEEESTKTGGGGEDDENDENEQGD